MSCGTCEYFRRLHWWPQWLGWRLFRKLNGECKLRVLEQRWGEKAIPLPVSNLDSGCDEWTRSLRGA